MTKSSSWKRTVILFTVAYLLVGGLALMILPGLLLQNWVPDATVEERGKLLGVAGQLVLFGLGGVIATVGVTLSLFRHRQEIQAAERDSQRNRHEYEKEETRREESQLQRRADAEREMRARFVTAVDLLSATAPIKHTAALYALAALADDWDTHGRPDEVQVCIDVICSYLRVPLPTGTTKTSAYDVGLKTTGFELIAQRLRSDSAHSWSDRDIDLSGVHIDFSVKLREVTIGLGGRLRLDYATIAAGGSMDLHHANIAFGGSVSLSAVSITQGGRVRVSGATVAGIVNTERADVSDGGVLDFEFAKVILGGRLEMGDVEVARGGIMNLADGRIADGGTLDLVRVRVGDGGTLNLTSARIASDGVIDLTAIRVDRGGCLRLNHAALTSDENLHFEHACVADGGLLSVEGATVGEQGRQRPYFTPSLPECL